MDGKNSFAQGNRGLLVLFSIVIGGIYSGVCTPTEAAGIGVVGVLGISLVQRKLNLKVLRSAMIDTAYVAAMIYGIILTGYLLARFLCGDPVLPRPLWTALADMGLNQYMFLLVVAVLYLILGTMLDMFGLLILTLPFFFPLVQHFQIDPVWFGVFAVIMAEVGLLSPPVGVNVFVMHASAPDIPWEKFSVAFCLLCS